jgi:1,4-dihydroxy-2-naphthoyl-CoA hydrolase
VKRLWRSDVTLEVLRAGFAQTLVSHLGMELVELGDDYLRGTMPVDHRTCQPMRVLHGGASVAFAETLASVAAAGIIDISQWLCFGQEINANHLRRVSEGNAVEGIARPFHVGARSQVWGVEIFDAENRRCCVARVTLAIVPRSAL